MSPQKTVLIIGASRGLGLGLVKEYHQRGWYVLATVRNLSQRTPLQEFREQNPQRLEIYSADINNVSDISSLKKSLDGRELDLLFVNAGIATDPAQPIGEVSTEDFIQVMLTNALSPMRLIETLIDQVSLSGQVAAMSSELGSIEGNSDGCWEAYRASKAALNMLMKSFVVRRGDTRSFYVVAPGWVRTDMGGPDAPLDIETSIPGVVNALQNREGSQGLTYLNYLNETLKW